MQVAAGGRPRAAAHREPAQGAPHQGAPHQGPHPGELKARTRQRPESAVVPRPAPRARSDGATCLGCLSRRSVRGGGGAGAPPDAASAGAFQPRPCSFFPRASAERRPFWS
ncbi:uncharacterized protein LOC116422762 [Sarcophilus harrisii]|uniref:uncharacterized protein LOC116422762 n=1 Tax=Sarcophilus harrisii TaxID=9305 RepID=UPI001301EAE5|nr:uncharacterized protein LOC116422762 [Sarcophilus harrisii]